MPPADPPPTTPVPPAQTRRIPRAAGLVAAALLLTAVAAASLALGTKQVPLSDVWTGLVHPDGRENHVIVHDLRLPRTLLGLLVGAALGLAGSVMQALTRNPLADPGLLGVNAGAAAAVVSAASFLGLRSLSGYLWFALLGAAVVSAVVYVLGGGRHATPVRLALSGTALTAALTGYVSAVILLDSAALDIMRFWTVGSLASANRAVLGQVAPVLIAGIVLALLLAGPLNALALGDDAARALGARTDRTRAAALIAITLLCGAATAACGPIVFLGLLAPHLVRPLSGPDLRWLLPYAALLAPALLLAADVLGRIAARPSELQAGITVAVVGAPLFVALVRRRTVQR
ncbi:iron ABC transporter permease [Catellatospora sp. TT07R-123]|uniref:FecCD family ABC transporter permease n=1 Tax=Catellatospora sp. TT07R-123 TaxID=2733863 RepID=UPI001B2B21DF|nr:iron chelate uptake ABC transporter family permease subunit [Catellatospora sp. TT07R-123]GHJ47824.1 iron ABC transporter permease [Catellatospora sp. TT07R-123]